MDIIKKFEKLGYKLAQQKHLVSLRDGLMISMPLVMAGSIFTIILSLPVPGWREFTIQTGIRPWLSNIVRGSFGIVALISSFGIAKNLADKYRIDGFSAGVISVSSYIILIPAIVSENKVQGIPYDLLGSSSLFVSIFVALITTELFRFFMKKNIVIKMPASVPPEISKTFTAVIPGISILFFWGIVSLIPVKLGFESIFQLIITLVSEPLKHITTGIFGTVIIVILNSLFWFLGLHGGQITSIITKPILLLASDQNRLAFEAGKELPNIVTSSFISNLVFMGGSGVTLGLAILLFLFSKSKQNKMLGKLVFSPGIFNINEPLIFGLPIVLNFKLVIPFILAPVVTTLVTYYATYFGLVAKTTGVIIPWATPPIISGYLVTGGRISGAVIQIITLTLSVLIYLPFFKSLEKDLLKEEEKLEKLNK